MYRGLTIERVPSNAPLGPKCACEWDIAWELHHRLGMRMGRFARFGWCLGSLMLVQACAIDNRGAVAAQVHRGDGAWVIDVYSVGGAIRPDPEDPGALLGLGRRSYVFDLRDSDQLRPGWHFFSADMPERRPVAIDSWTLGTELGLAGEVSLSAGYISVTRLAAIGPDDSVAFALDYSPQAPAMTRFTYLKVPAAAATP